MGARVWLGMDLPEPVLLDRTDQPYLGIRRTVTMRTIAEVADCIPTLIGALAQRGSAVPGPPFLRYHVIDMANQLEVEAGVPLAAPWSEAAAPPGGALPGALPAGRYASTTHIGAPDGLAGATAGLLRWAEGRGLRLDLNTAGPVSHWGCRLEVFRTDPRAVPDSSQWQTDLLIRLADGPG